MVGLVPSHTVVGKIDARVHFSTISPQAGVPLDHEKAAFGRLKHTLAAAIGRRQRVLSYIFEVLFEKYF